MGGGKSEVSAAGKGRVRGGMGMWQGGLSSMRYPEKSKMSTNKKGKTSRKEAQGKREGGNQGVMRGGERGGEERWQGRTYARCNGRHQRATPLDHAGNPTRMLAAPIFARSATTHCRKQQPKQKHNKLPHRPGNKKLAAP